MTHRSPIIQAFIFSWPGQARNALALRRQLADLVPATIVHSGQDMAMDGHEADFVGLDDDDYFSAQWNTAVALFTGDILWHIQADATCDRFDELLARARRVFATYPIGVYEPLPDYTDIQYDRSRLREIERDLYEIPVSDCTCWFVAGDCVRRLPALDTSINKYGWGICWAIAAIGRMNGALCVRDFAFTIAHPRGRGYSSIEAARQKSAWLATFDDATQEEFRRMAERREKCRPARDAQR